MLTATRPSKTVPLSSDDKAKIAAVLSWDLCKPVNPREVESIQVNGEWVAVSLTLHRAVPIHREVFRAILEQQKGH